MMNITLQLICDWVVFDTVNVFNFIYNFCYWNQSKCESFDFIEQCCLLSIFVCSSMEIKIKVFVMHGMSNKIYQQNEIKPSKANIHMDKHLHMNENRIYISPNVRSAMINFIPSISNCCRRPQKHVPK